MTTCPSSKNIDASSVMIIGVLDISSGRLKKSYDNTASMSSSYRNDTNVISNDCKTRTKSDSACSESLTTGSNDSYANMWGTTSSSATTTTSDYHIVRRTQKLSYLI